VRVEGGVIRDIRFEGAGCAISTASASLMTEAVKGRSKADAEALGRKFHALLTGTSTDLETGPELGKLEAFLGVRDYPARVKCATLAWHTLEAALEERPEIVTTE
jgi:nitrogen fixation NifU-like protein